MKKTLILAAVVVGVHCAAITGLFLVQGCKSTKGIKGPSASPTPVMPPLSAPAAAPAAVEPGSIAGKEINGEETIEYTVKSGDSLGRIARKHKVSKRELTELNKLADPNKIRVGQKLVIPKHAYIAVPPAPKAADTKSEAKHNGKKNEQVLSLATGINEYVVEAGDSLSKIAAKLNVKVSALREVNKLVNDKLKPGQKLIIPGATKVEGAPETAPAPAASELSPGPAKKPEAPAATSPSSDTVSPGASSKNSGSGITHVVLPNEDLSSIAKLYAVTMDEIVIVNQLGANRTVKAGQKIIIP